MQEYKVEVYDNGNKAWYQNGKRHRLDGPAVEYANGGKGKFWYQNDKLHRLDGPAVEYSDGYKEWFIEGKELSEEEFNARNKVEVTLEDIAKAMNIDIDKLRINKKITYEMWDMMWFDLREGRVNEEEWKEFCDALLEQEIDKTNDVAIRLKKLLPKTVDDFACNESVIYIPNHAGGDTSHPDCEVGYVSSKNNVFVFVQFPNQPQGQACSPTNLTKI